MMHCPTNSAYTPQTPSPPFWSAASLLPPLPSQKHPYPQQCAASSSLRAFATQKIVEDYLNKELTLWRIAPHLYPHNQAKTATKVAQKHADQTLQAYQAYLAICPGVSKSHAAASLAYTIAAAAYHDLGVAQASMISENDQCAKEHARLAQEHPKACRQHHATQALRASKEAMTLANQSQADVDPHIQATAIKATQAIRQVRKAHKSLTTTIKKAQKLKQDQMAIAQDYMRAAQLFAESAMRYAEYTQICATVAQLQHQANVEPSEKTKETLKASIKQYQDHAAALHEKAKQEHAEAIIAQEKAESLEQQPNHTSICTPFTSKITPITARLPFEAAVKEKCFLFIQPRIPHLAWLITRLACLIFTAPFSAMDLSYHAFWCTAKCLGTLVRGTLYTLSAGRYNSTFLNKHVSIAHSLYHAKMVAYFTLNLFFGPLVGAYSPSTLIDLQTRYGLTTDRDRHKTGQGLPKKGQTSTINQRKTQNRMSQR